MAKGRQFDGVARSKMFHDVAPAGRDRVVVQASAPPDNALTKARPVRRSARPYLASLLQTSRFIRWSLSMLACLIDDRCRQQLRGIEVADGESLEPSFLPALMQWSCARLTFHSLMSTRSEPHWQNKSTGTDRVYRHGEQKAKFSEFRLKIGENWPCF